MYFWTIILWLDLQIFLLINFYLNNFFRLPMNTLHWLTIIKQYRNVNVKTKIILSLPIDLPSAHHNTNIFVPVFHNFPLCHAPTYNCTHIYTYWYILLQNEIILYAIFYKFSVSLNVIHFYFILFVHLAYFSVFIVNLYLYIHSLWYQLIHLYCLRIFFTSFI